MKRRNDGTWISATKGAVIEVPTNARINLAVHGEGEIVIEGRREAGDNVTLATRVGAIYLSGTLHGLCAVEIKGKKFAYEYAVAEKQKTEPMDLLPPPVMREPKNYIQQMRQQFRQSMGITRESFLENDTALFSYELGDDDEIEFEEELADKARVEKQDTAKPRNENNQDKPDSEVQGKQVAKGKDEESGRKAEAGKGPATESNQTGNEG